MDRTKLEERLSGMKNVELVGLYNQFVIEMNKHNALSLGAVIKFSDHKTAVRRTSGLITTAWEEGIEVTGWNLGTEESEEVDLGNEGTFNPRWTIYWDDSLVRTDIPPEAMQELSGKVSINDAEIKDPAPKVTRRMTKAEKDHLMPSRVTKIDLIRSAFLDAGDEGITIEALAEASGYDTKNARVAMYFLMNPKRTKADKLVSFKIVGGRFYERHFAPVKEA